jgi:hypothetical protein
MFHRVLESVKLNSPPQSEAWSERAGRADLPSMLCVSVRENEGTVACALCVIVEDGVRS